jgi:hypothetical protein
VQRKGNRGGKSETQLMPGAQKQGRQKGTLARALGQQGNSSKQHMQLQKATGEATFACGYASKGTRRGTRGPLVGFRKKERGKRATGPKVVFLFLVLHLLVPWLAFPTAAQGCGPLCLKRPS